MDLQTSPAGRTDKRINHHDDDIYRCENRSLRCTAARWQWQRRQPGQITTTTVDRKPQWDASYTSIARRWDKMIRTPRARAAGQS